jgi:hypothetical protein
MADGEHPAVHAMKPAVADAVIDGAAAEAGIEQLAPAHHAMLVSGEHGDLGVRPRLVGLFIHHMNKPTGA